MNIFFHNDYSNIKFDYIDLLKALNEKPSYMTKLPLTGDIVNQNGGASVKKWSTLIHNGVMFYPDYVPHKIPIKYGLDKKIIDLNPEAEEFMTYYAQSRFDKYKTDKFNKNFFNDWRQLLTPELRKEITNLSLCDYSDIKKYIEDQSEQKKKVREDMTKEMREKQKKRKRKRQISINMF